MKYYFCRCFWQCHFFMGSKSYPSFYLRSTYDYHCHVFLSIEETTERLVSMFRYFRPLTVKKEILLHITIIFVNCILYKVKVLGIVVRLESLLSTAYIIMWTKRRTFSCCIFSGNITWFLVSIDNYIGVRERIIFFLLHIDNIVSKFFKHCLIWVIWDN